MSPNCEKSLGLLQNVLREQTEILDSKYKTIPVASAPMAAGVIALILQVNPDLNWRDVQHVTVRCAHNANLKANDWSTNAIGRNYSHSFGYGLMDAGCMVRHKVLDELKKIW